MLEKRIVLIIVAFMNIRVNLVNFETKSLSWKVLRKTDLFIFLMLTIRISTFSDCL